MKFRLLNVALIGLLTLAACSKKNDAPKKPATNVNLTDIMGNSGKRWDVDEFTKTYYSASGKVDSVATASFDDLYNCTFFVGSISENNLVFTADDPLTEVMPEGGSFTFNYANQTMSLTCVSSPGYTCNGNDGEWQITSFVMIDFSGNDGMDITRTVQLDGGRKVTYKVELLVE